MTAGVAVLIAGALIAIVCVVLGVGRLIGTTRALKRRIEAYRDLPLAGLAKTTQARVTLAGRRIGQTPILASRARTAVTDIAGAFGSMRSDVRQLIGAVRAAPMSLLGL